MSSTAITYAFMQINETHIIQNLKDQENFFITALDEENRDVAMIECSVEIVKDFFLKSNHFVGSGKKTNNSYRQHVGSYRGIPVYAYVAFQYDTFVLHTDKK